MKLRLYKSLVYVIDIQILILPDTRNESLAHENGLNWELFGARNNRFFLGSGSLGPAYLTTKSTASTDGINLSDLLDFEGNSKKKLKISTQKCPILLRKNLHELFPAPEVIAENEKLTLITLSQASLAGDLSHEKSAIEFVHAAREICSRLRLHGFWSDFLNPFSGRPFHSYHQKSLYKLNDTRFRGLCMKFEEIPAIGADENCVLICEDKSVKFSGSIFSNIPANLDMIKELINDD